jgi:hypothetical protein
MKKKGRPINYPEIGKEIKKLHKSKTGLKRIDIYAFKTWYESQNGCCSYCGVTSAESLLLFNAYPHSTRGGKRGKRLELDRKNPSIKCYGEDINNLALVCYWCNNAKTNYFTFEEFKIIGQSIIEIQKQRLRNINETN